MAHTPTHFFPPTLTFIVSLLSGAISPTSMLATNTTLDDDPGLVKPDTGLLFLVLDEIGGSNIWILLTNGV